MHLGLTFALFGAVTAVLFVLRLVSHRLPEPVQRGLLIGSCAGLLVTPVGVLTGWSFRAELLDALVYWWFLLSYEWLLLLFTTFRPRWLTWVLGCTLMLPILSASAFLPLTDLFDRRPAAAIRIGEDLYSQISVFHKGTHDGSGADLEVYYRPRWLPFMQKRTQGARYYSTQCNAERAYALLQPDRRHVQMNCPAIPGEPESAQSLVVGLR